MAAELLVDMDEEDFAEDDHPDPATEFTEELQKPSTKTTHTRISRKRTKTGSCRRRRIKCGEERPTCGNCIKSKRQCEGYNPRVIFKDPLSTYRIPASAASANQSFNAVPARGLSLASQYSQPHHVLQQQHITLPNIAPKSSPNSQEDVSIDSIPLPRPLPDYSQIEKAHQYAALPESNRGHVVRTSDIRDAVPLRDPPYDTIEPSYLPEEQKFLCDQISSETGTQNSFDHGPRYSLVIEPVENRELLQLGRSSGLNSASELPLQELIYQSNVREEASALLTQSYHGNTNWSLYQAQQNPSHPKYVPNPHAQTILIGLEQEVNDEVFPSSLPMPARQDWINDTQPLFVAERQEDLIPNDVKDDTLGVVVIPDDSLNKRFGVLEEDFFAKLDDEMEVEDYENGPGTDFGKLQYNHLRNNDLGSVVALQAFQDMQDQRLRTYHSFLDGYGPDVLSTYEPSARDSPLSDNITARIFCYFINVTGPSISLFERHPVNPSLMFQGHPVPPSQQHIWSYTMPTLALNNQALLHAMLAIGSLHMALLQESPITASLKHYHIAIRRVAKMVRLSQRRGQPATLAATLLLGWYELMSADHQKWSSHLLGARQLLKEVDFVGMTRYLRNKRIQYRQMQHTTPYHYELAAGMFEGLGNDEAYGWEEPTQDEVNENFVGMIMGRTLRYDQYGQVLEDFDTPTNQYRNFSRGELEMYESQRDLFWWYCKQDAFQSILSGNRLFMHYELWSQCPPRAPIGRRDAVYGTYDHLILLLGRLAEFAAKDLRRKKKALQANGGQWRPPSGGPGQPGSSEKAPPQQPGPKMPSFAGMMPGTEGKATLPRGFSPASEESPASDNEERNLDEWTHEAEDEWQEMRAAFNILEENYGPDFQPLGPEHSQPIDSPFGPALLYRTYSIAGIWMLHYMGLILCHRYHPSMPPAATVAAGIAARQTAFYANQVGRISTAIAPNAPEVIQLPTGVGAGLIECSFALFIAGVQYQDSAQRAWVVQRCSDIKRLTGWQTANAIAMGCESSWVKAAEIGRGPAYSRVIEKKIDQKIWYTARRRLDHVSSERQDRQKLLVARTDRVHYAVGLLGFEDDFENLAFENDYDPNTDAD